MAETCYPARPVAAATPAARLLEPYGQGVAAPPPKPAKPHVPSPAGKARPSWAAGAGQAGYLADVKFISTGGVRHKQLQAFAGASEAAAEQQQRATSARAAHRTIRDIAGPYQKAAAIRAAEGAVRPWSAYAGLGERRGAKFGSMLANAPAELKYGSDPTAPSAFVPPNTKYAAAVGARAEQVARPGTLQMDAPGAWSPVPGQPSRELWPVDLQNPPKWCAGCRGEHLPDRENNPNWEPYTPGMRLQNLNVLCSLFQAALVKGQLCLALNDSKVQPVRWTWSIKDKDGDQVALTPANMARHDFVKQLGLMFDGIREGHEPYRYLATLGVHAFLDTRSPDLVQAVIEVSRALRLALQTYEPSLMGHAMIMLQKYIKSHPKVGPALVPHLKQLLPPLALMRTRHFVVHLPPPFCVGAAGSFTGSGVAPETGARQCTVCKCPLDKVVASRRHRRHAQQAALDNPHLLEAELPREYNRHPVQGRWSKKYLLEEVIVDTLDLLVQAGGKRALAQVVKVVPTYSYHNPKD